MLEDQDPGPDMTSKQRLWWAGVLTAAMILIVTLTSACRPGQPEGLPRLYRPSVALLNMSGPDGGRQCTVWKISNELLATAGHCCEPDYTYTTTGPNAITGDNGAINVYDDDAHDVCILRGKLRGATIALAHADPDLGDPVWTAGYPMGWFLISSGFWSGRDENNEGICSVVVAGGASGSPILDDAGRAVGVLIKRARGMDNLTIVSPIEWLQTAYLIASRTPAGAEPVRLALTDRETDLSRLLDDLPW